MRISLLLFLSSILCCCQSSPDQTKDPSLPIDKRVLFVDTLEIYSPSMRKAFPALVILPESYAESPSKRYPSVYLLHGHGGDFTNWLDKRPNLQEWASTFEQIIVLPDGNKDSWYLDSPVLTDQDFGTYIGLEVPTHIDSFYRTIQEKGFRAISGLSMGGHGAFLASLSYPEQFGAVSSISGGLDLRPFPDSWNLKALLGPINQQAGQWEVNSVAPRLEEFKNQNTALFIDCGREDFFLSVNQQAHQQLVDLKIPHDYMTRPGGHNWDYWRKALPYHLLFFHQHFTQLEYEE